MAIINNLVLGLIAKSDFISLHVNLTPETANMISREQFAKMVVFADGYPVLVIGQASLDHLNERLAARGSPPVAMNRFRPNLVLDGLEPHDEDALASIGIDGVVLKPVKPCTRCQVTTIDQASANAGHEPLRTLSTYRRDDRLAGVTFGMNAIVIAGAGRRIAVGSTASCEFDF